MYVKDHVYLNADLTREQRQLDSKLRTELRRQRSIGEQNLAIRNDASLRDQLSSSLSLLLL